MENETNFRTRHNLVTGVSADLFVYLECRSILRLLTQVFASQSPLLYLPKRLNHAQKDMTMYKRVNANILDTTNIGRFYMQIKKIKKLLANKNQRTTVVVIQKSSVYFFTVPPVIIDNMTSTDMVVREGTNVTMVCRATGYPEPYVMWRREDGQEFNCNGEQGYKHL